MLAASSIGEMTIDSQYWRHCDPGLCYDRPYCGQTDQGKSGHIEGAGMIRSSQIPKTVPTGTRQATTKPKASVLPVGMPRP